MLFFFFIIKPLTTPLTFIHEIAQKGRGNHSCMVLTRYRPANYQQNISRGIKVTERTRLSVRAPEN